MNTKVLIGGLIGGLVLFALGFLIYILLLPDLFAYAEMRETPLLGVIIVGELVYGLLLALVLKGTGNTTWMDGAKHGAVLGLLVAAGFSLIFYGASTVGSAEYYVWETLSWAVRWAGAGAAVGWWLGRDASTTSSTTESP